ncbi:exosome nuclease subunit [Podila epigama]|nr:exosome nuclease subunit [Podila epigama]
MAKELLADFDTWQNTLLSTLVKATKAANAIPANDVSFYRSLDRNFATNMNDASSASLDLCNQLLGQASNSTAEVLMDGDDVRDRFDIISDVIDNLLEKVDVTMDEMKGINKKGSTSAQSAPTIALAKTEKLDYKLVHAQHIVRPQLRFPDPVDNSNSPFIRKITYKPNAKVDLSYGLEKTDSAEAVLPHPYEYEIKHLEYPAHMFEQRPEQLYLPFNSTTAIWVDTVEALKDMCKTLEMQREIAVDLEHHNYRSFQGFVCLMQVSTRDQDFLIDTLELRGHLHLLNQSFTDPNIVKIFHGAESDIIWLQRDFGVYIVNLFDTFHASKLLEMEAHSLAHLLKLYANFDADKRYQLADWRIRPLPEEMFKYARSDTHFLLYIYDRMRNALLDKSNPTTHNLLKATLQRSAETSLKRHEKEIYDAEEGDGPGGWRNMYTKWNRSLNNQQFAVFKALHAWRDQMARDEDESLRYILPNHMLFTLAEKMPDDSTGVLGCCNPVPPSVRMNSSDIAMLISMTKLSVPTTVGGFHKVEIKEPVHVRFDPATGLQGTDENIAQQRKNDSPIKEINESSSKGQEEDKAKTNKVGNVVAATSSGMFGKGPVAGASEVKPVVAPAKLLAKSSSLFGNASLTKTSNAVEEAKKKAQQIMMEFSAQPAMAVPVFKEINTVIEKAPEEETSVKRPEAPTEPEEAPVAKKSRTDVLVLKTMSKQRSRALDEERAELSVEEVSSTAEEDDQGDDDETVKTKQDKPKKKNKKAAKAEKQLTGPHEPEDLPESFQPFDYSTVSSVVDETINSAKAGSRKKNKKIVAPDASEPAEPFDPYAKLVEDKEFKKKDASFSRAPKSGARSMTFTRN